HAGEPLISSRSLPPRSTSIDSQWSRRAVASDLAILVSRSSGSRTSSILGSSMATTKSTTETRRYGENQIQPQTLYHRGNGEKTQGAEEIFWQKPNVETTAEITEEKRRAERRFLVKNQMRNKSRENLGKARRILRNSNIADSHCQAASSYKLFIASGLMGEPVPPRNFSGVAINTNSYTFSAASCSRFRHSMM